MQSLPINRQRKSATKLNSTTENGVKTWTHDDPKGGQHTLKALDQMPRPTK